MMSFTVAAICRPELCRLTVTGAVPPARPVPVPMLMKAVVGVDVLVGVTVGVDVFVGVDVVVGVGVFVGVDVVVGVAVGVLVGVNVGVLVGVFVGVHVGVAVPVWVAVGVAVGVRVGVKVGPINVTVTEPSVPWTRTLAPKGSWAISLLLTSGYVPGVVVDRIPKVHV